MHGQKNIVCFLFSFPLSYLIFLEAVKGLSYTTFIRLGVIWGCGKGAFDKGMFGRSWGCHDDAHIESMYTTLVSKLEEQPLGPFDALSFLIGQPNALVFAKRLNLITRPL